jgi:hypothetical protein
MISLRITGAAMNKLMWVVSLASIVLTASFARAQVQGNYVEARSASVFAGACHFNGELVTTGREAILAWNITDGEFDKVNLAGVRAVAVVSSPANLSEERAARKTELLIDSHATEKQAGALVALLKKTSSSALGEVVAIKRAEIAFETQDGTYRVTAGECVRLDVKPMPNAECCRQPNNVWYSPLVKLDSKKVGYTTEAHYAGGAAGAPWTRGDENSGFYGHFSL